MKTPAISRRNFIRLGAGAVTAACLTDGFLLEPEWIRIRRINLAAGKPACRLVHFTDIHFKGDSEYLARAVEKINSLSADIVCFTGDIIEERSYLKVALDILAKVSCPMYGVPGNHEYHSRAPFGPIAECFRSTGGAWLVDRQSSAMEGNLSIFGAKGEMPLIDSTSAEKKILLVHCPDYVDILKDGKFDLILAGHSHGGQVRIPFYGPLVLPYGVGRYDRGLYHTQRGPLHVSPGLGTWYIPVRFLCRPEITVIEL